MVSFAVQKLFSFIWSSLFIFAFDVKPSKKIVPTTDAKELTLYVFLGQSPKETEIKTMIKKMGPNQT